MVGFFYCHKSVILGYPAFVKTRIMASPGKDTAFLLSSSQPDDLDDLISFDQASKEAHIASSIQSTVFVGEVAKSRAPQATDFEGIRPAFPIYIC